MKNFAILKESIYNEILNCLKEDRARAKKLVKGYIKLLKKYPTLQEAFYIHNNLEQGSFQNEDVKHGFIIENLNAIKHLNRDELMIGLNALDQYIKSNQINYATDMTTLSEKISDLMINANKTNKSVENNKAIEYIIETVSNRPVIENQKKPISHKIFKEVAQKNYNEKYKNLSETEKRVIKSFFVGNREGILKEYQNLLSEVTTNINQKIQETEDKDTKIKLYEVKDKLLTIPENITLEHFKKLLQLKDNL